MGAVRSFFAVSPRDWEWRFNMAPMLLILSQYAPFAVLVFAVIAAVLVGFVARIVAEIAMSEPAAPICPGSQNMRTMKPPEADTSGGF